MQLSAFTGGSGWDRDLVWAIARRDLRLLLRGRSIGYLLLVGLLLPSAIYAAGVWYGSHREVSPALVRDTAVICHFAMLLLASAGWTLGMIAREAREGRIEELLLVGCHPREMVAAVVVESLAILGMLAVAGLPLLVLAIVPAGAEPWQAPLTALAEVVSGFLFIAVGLALQGANRSLSTNPRIMRRILFHALWFFALLGISLHLLGGNGMPLVFRMLSGMNPFDTLLSTARPDDSRWMISLPPSALVSWLVAGRVIAQANRFPEDPEGLALQRMSPQRTWGSSALSFVTARPVTGNAPALSFESGNPVATLDRRLGRTFWPGWTTVILLFLGASLPVIRYIIHLGRQGDFLPSALLAVSFMYAGVIVVRSAVSFQRDAAEHRFGLLLLSRLSDLEIFLGKLLGLDAIAFGRWSAAALLASPFLMLHGILAVLGFLATLAFFIAAVALAALVGARCRTVNEAAFAAIGLTAIPAWLGVSGGLGPTACLHPASALETGDPIILLACLAIYGTLCIATFAIASRYLDRIVLR